MGFIISVTIYIKGVPDEVAALLRDRAERHHRSLQGELLAIVEAAARGAAGAPALPAGASPVADNVVGYDSRGLPITRKGPRRIEEVAVELKARTPSPRTDLPLSVDLVRKMRDSR
jgi:plasmid stability protein